MDDTHNLSSLENELFFAIRKKKEYRYWNTYRVLAYTNTIIFLLVYSFIYFYLFHSHLNIQKFEISDALFKLFITLYIGAIPSLILVLLNFSLIEYLVKVKLVNDPKDYKKLLEEIEFIKVKLVEAKNKKTRKSFDTDRGLWNKKIKPFLNKFTSFFKSKSVLEKLIDDYNNGK